MILKFKNEPESSILNFSNCITSLLKYGPHNWRSNFKTDHSNVFIIYKPAGVFVHQPSRGSCNNAGYVLFSPSLKGWLKQSSHLLNVMLLLENNCY